MSGAIEQDIVRDGTLANDSTQSLNLWQLREGITEAISREGQVYKYDISLPIPHLYSIVEEIRKRLSFIPASVKGFGHMGDGNLHLNIVSGAPTELVMEKLEPFVYEWTAKNDGSISAEHGIGLSKSKYLRLSKDKNVLSLMASLKNQFDRNGILNPYKTLPQE